MYCHDTRHTSLSPYNTSNQPETIKWRVIMDWTDGGIAIGADGTLYFGSDAHMNAVYPNGTIKWQWLSRDFIDATPAIANNGTIYVGDTDEYLYAFNPDGTVQWSCHCGGIIGQGSPAIAPDGTIYTATDDGGYCLVAVTPHGHIQWKYKTGASVDSAPVIGLDGVIIIGSEDRSIYAVNPNGTLRWRYQTGDRVMGSASIASDGTVYKASWDGYLYALNPANGSLIWKCRIGSGSKANPAIGADGTIYIGEGTLFAIYPNGTLRWSLTLDDNNIEWSSPAVSADGIIYFGTEHAHNQGGEIFAVNPNGTIRWRQTIAKEWVDSSPAIGADGTVYIGSDYDPNNGYLYAFGQGPLNCDPYGPYEGHCDIPLQFNGDAFGGTPPYTFHWDFGDGNTADQQNPAHNYTTIGNFTATLTVTDNQGNQSNATTNVTITYQKPWVNIIKPENHIIYFFNKPIPFLGRTFIIGPVTVSAKAGQIPFGINHVDFYLDGHRAARVKQEPYSWNWIRPSLIFPRLHTIEVIAYDNLGNQATITIYLNKLL